MTDAAARKVPTVVAHTPLTLNRIHDVRSTSASCARPRAILAFDMSKLSAFLLVILILLLSLPLVDFSLGCPPTTVSFGSLSHSLCETERRTGLMVAFRRDAVNARRRLHGPSPLMDSRLHRWHVHNATSNTFRRSQITLRYRRPANGGCADVVAAGEFVKRAVRARVAFCCAGVSAEDGPSVALGLWRGSWLLPCGCGLDRAPRRQGRPVRRASSAQC
jgi:hypothetical protein